MKCEVKRVKRRDGGHALASDHVVVIKIKKANQGATWDGVSLDDLNGLATAYDIPRGATWKVRDRIFTERTMRVTARWNDPASHRIGSVAETRAA